MDRKIAPKATEALNFNFSKAKTLLINESLQLHYIHQEDLEVIRLEFVFDAGTIYQQKKLAASFTNALIFEGSSDYTSKEIANIFEAEGAFLEQSCQAEKATLSIYCLAKSIKKIIPLFKDIIFNASLPKHEFKKMLEIKKQGFQVNCEKVGFQAKNKFLPYLFGKDHSYSNELSTEDYDAIEHNDILAFYENFYIKGSFEIFVAGKVDDKMISFFEKTFKNLHSHILDEKRINLSLNPYSEKVVVETKPDAIQSAIRVGRITINRNHSDFPKLFITNMVLGGYFGSRLMSNIREDKGYTYGIGSGVISYKNLAYFVISTEVGVDVTKLTLNEIEKELERLHKDLIEKEELQLVKNYIRGNLVRGFDGAFASMDRYKMLQSHNLEYTYYDNLIKTIQDIRVEDIRETAGNYLSFNEMHKLVVGKI